MIVQELALFDLEDFPGAERPRVGDLVRRGDYSRTWKVEGVLLNYMAWDGRDYVELVAAPKSAGSVNSAVVYLEDVRIVQRARPGAAQVGDRPAGAS